MKVKHQNINDEFSYFNTVVRNMNVKDRIKLSKIKDHEVQL